MICKPILFCDTNNVVLRRFRKFGNLIVRIFLFQKINYKL